MKHKVRVGLGIILGGVLSVNLLTNPASATSVQYSFTGTVDHVQNQLSSQFNTSQSMSGSMQSILEWPALATPEQAPIQSKPSPWILAVITRQWELLVR